MVNCSFSDNSHSSIVLEILLHTTSIGPQQRSVTTYWRCRANRQTELGGKNQQTWRQLQNYSITGLYQLVNCLFVLMLI